MSGLKTAQGIVFADIVGSTHLFEKYGNVRAQHLVSKALALLIDVTTAHGGTLIKTIGDEVMATFEDRGSAFEAVSRMPAVIREDPTLAAIGLSIKVGLHFGEVVTRDNDVFGDAVNVAARMTALAKADQILTTRSTVQGLSPEAPFALRSLGPMKVRGKKQAIEVIEVLWQDDQKERTILDLPAYRPQTKTRLIVHYQQARLVIDTDQPFFRLGRDERSDLVVEQEWVSRGHARIEFNGNHFVLIDSSTNGTYLRLGADETIFLHHDQIPLHHEGFINLGRDPSLDEDGAIRFVCES